MIVYYFNIFNISQEEVSTPQPSSSKDGCKSMGYYFIIVQEEVSTPQPSKRGRKSKGAVASETSTPAREASPENEMPSVTQV